MAPQASPDPEGPLLSDAASLESLQRFTFTSLLGEDTLARSVTLLGTYSRAPSGTGDDVPALLTLERQPFARESVAQIVSSLGRAKSLLQNDVYHLFVGWTGGDAGQGTSTAGSALPSDLKITLVQPASEKHIRKASKQEYRMIRETPAVYAQVVKPYIDNEPIDRLQWVYNILAHKTEYENVIFEDPDPDVGYIILPDLKWDQSSPSMLYLQCIVHTRSLSCLRDINPSHLPMLRSIRANAAKAAEQKYAVQPGELRMFVHYQPSFYHFHVHIVHVSCHSYAGSTIGQSHLLDSIIDNLELEESSPAYAPGAPSYYARRTLTYALGEQHGLYPQLWQATQQAAAAHHEG